MTSDNTLKSLPNKYIVLIAAIISSFMLWLTFNDHNPAGAQPATMFGITTIFGWFSVILAFTEGKLWNRRDNQ